MPSCSIITRRSSSGQGPAAVPLALAHPVEDKQLFKGDIVQMIRQRHDRRTTPPPSSSSSPKEDGEQQPSSSSEASAASDPSPADSSLLKRGRNVSGRSWKVRAQRRASTVYKSTVNGSVKDWTTRQANKRLRLETLGLQAELKEAKRQEILAKKERRLENEKRRQENELRNMESRVQTLNYSRVGQTLKSLNKKQLRQIKKTRVNAKTGVVEYVPAYSK